MMPIMRRYLLYSKPVDMRLSYDGLMAMVRNALGENPLSGTVFVFINVRRTHIKCIYYEPGGLCLWGKRLEAGRFESSAQTGSVALSQAEFHALIEGLKIHSKSRIKRHNIY